MFILQTTKERETVLMKDGKPFVYSSRNLAHMARKILETERKESLVVFSL